MVEERRARRINFEVSDELYDVVEELTTITDSSSKAELMRKAIALMKVAAEARQNNERIMIADAQRNPISELVL